MSASDQPPSGGADHPTEPSSAKAPGGKAPAREAVSISDITRAAGGLPPEKPPWFASVGVRLFAWLLLFIAGFGILLAVWAIVTYPRMSTYMSYSVPCDAAGNPVAEASAAPATATPAGSARVTSPTSGSTATPPAGGASPTPPATASRPATLCAAVAMQSWQQSRDQWGAMAKDLGTTFIVTPLIPLLGAILGYIFGKSEQQQE